MYFVFFGFNKSSIDRLSRTGFFLLALVWFALSPLAQAQDGDELNGNTAEGGGALLHI